MAEKAPKPGLNWEKVKKMASNFGGPIAAGFSPFIKFFKNIFSSFGDSFKRTSKGLFDFGK